LAVTDKRSNRKDSYFVSSEKLGELKDSIAYLKQLGFSSIESPAQYRLVVDTNIILQDLIWLVCNRQNKSAKSSLQEIVDSTAVEIFAPPRLIVEIERHIGAVAIKKGIDKGLLEVEWAIYRERIKFLSPDDDLVQELKYGVDPDDADFVALAKQISALGVVSKDPHVAQMGGNQLCFDILFSFRDFARSKAIELNIKVMGSFLSLTTLALVVSLVKGIGKGIQKLPDWAKLGAIIVLVVAYTHPTSRKRINDFVGNVFDSIIEASPALVEPIKIAAEEARVQGEIASKKMADISAMSKY